MAQWAIDEGKVDLIQENLEEALMEFEKWLLTKLSDSDLQKECAKITYHKLKVKT